MSNQWKCIHCGQNNPKAMRFCPNCGKPNAAENAPTVAAKSSYAPAVAKAKSAASPRNNRKLLIGAAIALWVTGLLVLAGGGFMWWNRSQEEAAQITAATVKAAIAQTQIAQAVTNTPAPTSTPPPEDTVVATEMPTETPVEKSAAFAPTKESVATENSVSSGDVLSLPTATVAPTSASSNAPIAFIQGGYHLFTILPDGTNQQEIPLPTDGVYYPQWSPDGRHISFDHLTLWIMDADGGNPQAVVKGNHPAWSPDQKQLIFDRKQTIYAIDLETKQERYLAEGYWYPAWSPDGQTISFYEAQNGATDVYLINADGSNLRPLTQTPDIAEYAHNNAWSPDGKYLLIAAGEKFNDTLGAPYSDNSRLEIIEVSTGARHKVTDVNFTGSAAWSPDAKQIVFADYADEGTNRKLQLFIIDVDGDNRRQLTSGNNDSYAPTWGGIAPQTKPSSAIADAASALSKPTSTPTPQPTATPKPVYVAPAPTVAPNCPAPGAQISSPYAGTRFTRRNNFIIGTANIPRLHHWKIEYSTDPNGGWQYLLERDYPVENDKLVMIDASTIPRGPYGLRLTVVEDTGNYPEPCEVWFTNAY